MKPPKPGTRFVSRHTLDNAAFAQGRRDVYAMQVVTATRKVGSQVVVYYTSAEAWDQGSRKGRWYFDLAKADDCVREWLA